MKKNESNSELKHEVNFLSSILLNYSRSYLPTYVSISSIFLTSPFRLLHVIFELQAFYIKFNNNAPVLYEKFIYWVYHYLIIKCRSVLQPVLLKSQFSYFVIMWADRKVTHNHF